MDDLDGLFICGIKIIGDLVPLKCHIYVEGVAGRRELVAAGLISLFIVIGHHKGEVVEQGILA